MKKVISLVTFCTALISNVTFSAQGYLVKGAKLTTVSSTSNNVDAFWVYYEGGQSDKCNGRVKFIATNAGTAGVFERSFSLTMSALVANKDVEIYSYTDNTNCHSAVSINMKR